ncbi:MAG: hypothetical protein KDI83_19365 [Gammaproteobacteria bacterium]|nr:hypothetical protein [Gammaproteobacteria bacterium]MCP5417010.1 hypothetical protein [Chromatiaceae bacterium]
MKELPGFALKTTLLCALLSGCYIIPMDQYGNPVYPGPYTPAGSSTETQSGSVAERAGPITLSVRLYPNNEIAAETGIVSGAVTNMLTGKGRFVLTYKGDTYSGEATRVSDEERRGVASAFSQKGGYMSCEYQMNTPRQGAGTCTFSDGAEYKLHIGG